MFGLAYSFPNECCNTLISKQEISQIAVVTNETMNPNTSSRAINPQGN
jgi:hypothetical protein